MIKENKMEVVEVAFSDFTHFGIKCECGLKMNIPIDVKESMDTVIKCLNCKKQFNIQLSEFSNVKGLITVLKGIKQEGITYSLIQEKVQSWK